MLAMFQPLDRMLLVLVDLLQLLNLSNWDVTQCLTNMSAMFYDCTNLVPIGVEDWDTQSLLNAQQMFRNTQLFDQVFSKLGYKSGN